MTTLVHAVDSNSPYWNSLLKHLESVNMFRYGLIDGEAKPNTYYFGIIIDESVIAHISIKQQPLLIPESYLIKPEKTQLMIGQTALTETFVQTFAVDEAFRRRGYGRALQQTAIDKTRALGCYQMRSWSSADRPANYALKLSMGFAVLPSLYPMPGGQPISGVYFVMKA